MNRHFRCSACGKCCYGQLPLTWSDAEANADKFPIGLVWTPVSQSSKDFKFTSHIGVTIPLDNRVTLAVLIVPTSFIPASQACPALLDNNLCGIHDQKPLRCRTMPFYPYRDERFQHEVMRFKGEWSCETDPSAPLVYADGRVVDRKDFDTERQKILEEVPLMRRYAAYMFKYSPHIVRQLTVASAHPQAKHIITSLSSFMTAIRYPHMKSIAEKQIPVLDRAITRCHDRPELGEFLRHYEVWRKEMSYI